MALFAILYFGCIVLCGIIAYRKSRRIWIWVLFSLIFWAAALLLLVLLPTRHAAREADRRVKAEHRRGMMECPYCLTMIPSEAAVCRHCQRDVASRDLVEVAR